MPVAKPVETEHVKTLDDYKAEVSNELNAILEYWDQNVTDEKQGGFYGAVTADNKPDLSAPKGIVLNSRILWAFSAASRYTKDQDCLTTAARAFRYIIDHFIDHKQGGVFWSVDHNGKMLEGRKQVYGLAFCIYGMAEYYKVTGDGMALDIAKDLYDHIERFSLDKTKGGYIEAFTREWKPLDDLRLSEKDDNEKKTMNTHLHIVEAYANLYQVWPDKLLKEKIAGLLDIFDSYIINKDNYHLNLFMNEDWEVRSSLQSFGHDIEASWLLQECAEALENKLYTDHFKQLALPIADAAAEGLDKDGGMMYEYDPKTGHWVKEKHSWPQAEAMIGFFNAYQLSGNERYLQYSLDSWQFIKRYIKDHKNGEWFWGVEEDYSKMQRDKAGFWKCPYHNARACMEIIHRIEQQ